MLLPYFEFVTLSNLIPLCHVIVTSATSNVCYCKTPFIICSTPFSSFFYFVFLTISFLKIMGPFRFPSCSAIRHLLLYICNIFLQRFRWPNFAGPEDLLFVTRFFYICTIFYKSLGLLLKTRLTTGRTTLLFVICFLYLHHVFTKTGPIQLAQNFYNLQCFLYLASYSCTPRFSSCTAQF